ncbi:MAG TPA: ribosome maturation factor RimM [Thermoflexales bacterium]|nr:ribosome maturation factor RimM [Thermoflexales bacterium]HQW34484.1 ribosome maturation factor RimM [Thermoflexales bacterium]HQX75227.1 ribosome maturation factor RimM [Thermoflexales bacterium]HQZ22832.1 ribosome maturation factor RimM [Thermoflexales bacterium]HRA01370.1 ribosome maturation factor RimM [Thermoflexales bacterium]
MNTNTLIFIGKITRPHGILGEVKVQTEPEMFEVLMDVKQVYLGKDRKPYTVTHARGHQDAFLFKLKEVPDRNAAETLRGLEVFVDETDLPDLEDGEYYAHDLIGLKVLDENGAELGEVADVLGTGANDVYVVQGGPRELLLPAIESVILEIDLDAETMRVKVPEGL